MTKSIGLIDNKASEADIVAQIHVKLIEIVKRRKEQKIKKASPGKIIEIQFKKKWKVFFFV